MTHSHHLPLSKVRFAVAVILLPGLECAFAAKAATPFAWISPNAYRTWLTVDPKGAARSNSPVTVNIDFAPLLAGAGRQATFDPDTIEIIGYDGAGAPRVFDSSRAGHEQHLLPWRVDAYYGITQVSLSFVMPDERCTQYAVYFDTVGSGLGKPWRCHGLVGNGDWFTDGYSRREINACGYDTFCDVDGDGDLDILKGGTEPFVFVYENVGGGRFADRGRMTSNGDLFVVPYDGNNRSWHSVEACDWDGDGDQDLFIYSPTGPCAGHVVRFENTGGPRGAPSFVNRGPLVTQSGQSLGNTINFVDWDGDGRKDVMSGKDGVVTFHRNISPNNAVANMQLANGLYVKANGVEIQLGSPRIDCADIDTDGDLDLFVGTEEGRIYFFENVGTRLVPAFIVGRIIAFHEYMDARAGVKVADFDGDGLLDFVPGRFWERTQWGEQPRLFGRLYKNVGSPTAPRFEARDAYGGAPYTERFQNADAVRQNGVRAVDWNNDGCTDLIAADTDGFVWYFQNQTSHLFPVFAPGVKITAAGRPLRVYGEEDYNRAAGYARCEICDWNEDGRKDLLVADGRAWLWLYLNEGTDANPVLTAGTRLSANGKPIDGTSRGSVLVCDWDNDGRKDVIFGMVGHGGELASAYYDWPRLNADPSTDRGFLFYKNVGTNASPILAYPEWIMAGPNGGAVISYTRPNLGSFVDWDGDGKKDFIACEFEHNVRFYRNTGTGGPNEMPRFASSADGIKIVQPWTVQMISGADVIDWNRDGDLDVITGQGHGGSGLRFYERDYINDCVNETVYGLNTYPVATVGRTETSGIRPDLDGDGDVDLADFSLFQLCFSGPNTPALSGCQIADFDLDADVDLADFAALQACFNGPNRRPGCWLPT